MKQKKILLIEDDLTLLELLKERLKKEGYDVIFEKNGRNGFFTAKKEMPDLTLLDIILPEMDGLSVLKEIRQNEETKSLPVIIISNSGQPVEIEEIKKLGVFDYFIKTEFDPKEIVDKVNIFFNQNFSRAQNAKEEVLIVSEEKQMQNYPVNKIKVMIVEDDKFLRDLISQKIVKEGMEVMLVSSAEEADAAIKKERPSIILLDIILPGLSGFDFLKMIKADSSLSDIPVIILSNLGEEKERETAINLGAKNFLVKATHTPNEIIEEIKRVIKESYL